MMLVSARPANRGRERSERLAKVGGEAGIRTLGRALRPYNGLANRRLQPLGHLTTASSLLSHKDLMYQTFDPNRRIWLGCSLKLSRSRR
jgi:hypothetical protein